jgi:hypothetical protein
MFVNGAAGTKSPWWERYEPFGIADGVPEDSGANGELPLETSIDSFLETV